MKGAAHFVSELRVGTDAIAIHKTSWLFLSEKQLVDIRYVEVVCLEKGSEKRQVAFHRSCWLFPVVYEAKWSPKANFFLKADWFTLPKRACWQGR